MNLPALYAQLINSIGDGTGLTDSLLHVHAGMAILILTRIITRRSLATPLPLIVVVIAEAANEILDRLHYGSWRWSDTLGDVANTLFWPMVLFIGLRLSRARGDRNEERKGPATRATNKRTGLV